MEQTNNPAVTGDKEQASYGKFNSADELLKAYNSLESEFTKRSQRLKQLESTQAASEWESRVGKLIERYPIAAQLSEEIGAEIEDKKMIKDENCLEKALLNVLSKKYKTPTEQAQDETVIGEVLKNGAVRERIIDEYREKVTTTLPKTMPKGGELHVVPPVRPSNIFEAGKAALEILKNTK